MIVAGIMSGTSLDGIDVAVVDIGRSLRTLAWRTVPYSSRTRDAILAVSDKPCHTAAISRLHFLLPRLYAQALGDWVKRYRVELIGCHGQTIFHEPGGVPPNTLQIGDGSVLAELTGVPVVSDFRPRDVAAGGQGAPLVPFADFRLFRHRTRRRAALNIGGIANVTLIPASAKESDVVAFDTGPGNIVMDGLVRHFTAGRRRFDRNGRIAARGRLLRPLLAQLLADPYYLRKPPKSAGREQYGDAFVARLVKSGASFPDLVATATALTAATIARAVSDRSDDLIVSGGGVHNPQLMGQLAALVPRVRVQSSNDYGIDADAKEAICFGLLAYETWRGRPSNVPAATGARNSVVLGKISV